MNQADLSGFTMCCNSLSLPQHLFPPKFMLNKLFSISFTQFRRRGNHIAHTSLSALQKPAAVGVVLLLFWGFGFFLVLIQSN